MSSSSIGLGDGVTLTATVTGTSAPTGSVIFTAQQSGGSLLNLGTSTLSATSGTQSQATFVENGFQGGSYTVVANYRSDNSPSFSNSTSAGQLLTVASVVLHNTTMTLSANPSTVNDGDTANFVATVTENDGGGIVPTGTVTFHAQQNGTDAFLGSANLDGTGTATLSSGPWLAGTYTVIASYEGDQFDHASGAQLTLAVGAGAGHPAETTTVVIASPTAIHTGDSTTFDAAVTQVGTHLPPPAGDAVEFRANGIFLGQTDLDANGHAILTVGGWLSGTYTIEADYVGDIFNQGSSGSVTLSVTDPLPTTTTYTGDTSAVYGGQTTLKANLIDATTGLPLVNQTVAISVNSGQPGALACSGTTDLTGQVSCTTTMTLLPGSYPIAAAFAGQGGYLPSGDNETMVVSPLHTTTTAGNVSTTTGSPTTLTGHLVDQYGNPLPAGTSVTLSIAGHSEICTGTTDASGNVSCVITPSENTGSYTINATFAGILESDNATPIYLGSLGVGTMTIVSGIPTLLPYNGDTTVQQGASAHISFILKNKNTNAVLPNQAVTVTFDGQTFNLTSDGSGVVQTNHVVNDPAGSNLPATASFGGSSPYLGSSGSGNVFVTSPTTLTYTGPSMVTEGSNSGKTLISFVLKDGAGNVLPNQKVSLAFGSQSCSNLTTDATGSVSCLVTTPAPGTAGGYTPTASYAKTTNYGASTGAGSFIVIAPTTLTYTGDTTATRGGTTTLKGLLKDGFTGGVLAGQPITWTLGTGATAQTCTATTDATGLASCTVTNTQLPSATPYPVAGSFGGSTYYLQSAATGNLTVSTSPLTVTADNKSMTQGGTVPPLTYSVTGFVSGDTLGTSDVTGTAVCTTTATSLSAIGVYPITCTVGSFESTNYTFRFVAGQISVLPASMGCGTTGHCESLLADPSPAQGAQVTPGQTMTIAYMDDSPIGDGTKYKKPSVSLNGQLLPLTVTSTSGYPQNYVDTWGGSTSTAYESLLTFQVPAGLANGQYSFLVTIFDGDGDGDQWAWNVGVGMLGQGGGGGGTGIATAMTLTAPATIIAGSSVTLTGTLKAANKGVAAESVSLGVSYDDFPNSNVSCTATTNAQGVATCSVTPTQLGTADVTAKFLGDSKYGSSSDADDTTVVAGTPTSLTVRNLAAMVQVNKATAVSATLLSKGAPFANANVTFTIGTATCTAKTNAQGLASCNITPSSLGAQTLTVSFAGDATHAGSSASQATTVVTTFSTALSVTTVPALHYNKAAAIVVTLTSNGGPVANQKITITLGGVTASANTNAQGVATINITPKVAGAATLSVSYSGDGTCGAATTVSQTVTVSAT
jgi:adhesin/invasin